MPPGVYPPPHKPGAPGIIPADPSPARGKPRVRGNPMHRPTLTPALAALALAAAPASADYVTPDSIPRPPPAGGRAVPSNHRMQLTSAQDGLDGRARAQGQGPPEAVAQRRVRIDAQAV